MNWTLNWTIPEERLTGITEFYRRTENTPMVRRRKIRNIDREDLNFSRDFFIKAILCCLCTSQQASGPTSRVANFFRTSPFLVTEAYCEEHVETLATDIQAILSSAGLRFGKKIGDFLDRNLDKLEGSNWELLGVLEGYATINWTEAAWEKEIAEKISSNLADGSFKLIGFGPKQARNLLQIMGVSRYEIPLDSRFSAWLSKNGFPYYLSAQSLQHPALYDILIESIKELCQKIKVYPCLLDAAVFSAEDGAGWTDENMIF